MTPNCSILWLFHFGLVLSRSADHKQISRLRCRIDIDLPDDSNFATEIQVSSRIRLSAFSIQSRANTIWSIIQRRTISIYQTHRRHRRRPFLASMICDSASDVPGRAWAQTLGSGWASEGLGLRNLKPDPELRAGLGSGLVGLKPGLSSHWQNSNATIVGQKSIFLGPIACQKSQTSST